MIATPKKHQVNQITSPSRFLVRCNCGLHFETLRKQNALGRASKIRGAVNAHFKAVGLTPPVGDSGVSADCA